MEGEEMDSVNRTLYIPLYGKAYVSARGLFLEDRKAEEIWAEEGFTLRGKAKSKWLAFYMGIRSAVFDLWLRRQMPAMEDAAILHIGCGMDSRVLRVGTGNHRWYDVDFPEVIRERKRYYAESDGYRMIAGDARERQWLDEIGESRAAIVVMEGVSMYMTTAELQALMAALEARFDRIALLMDCYTVWAARASKYKNPINDVGVTTVYGLDDPALVQSGRLVFAREHDMTPGHLVDELRGAEKRVFSAVFAGRLSRKLYRLYEYRKA